MRQRQEQLLSLRELAINDIVGFAESIYRVRNNLGQLINYNMTEPHKRLLRTGIVGNGTERFRVINKGRQIGFSVFMAVESILIAKLYPFTEQWYIATKEAKAKEWLKKVERISMDSRVMIDGTRIIDLDDKKSSVIVKVFRHLPKDIRKEIEYSYITGLAASPRERGMTGINVMIDEYDHMNKEIDMQQKIYTALKPVLSQPGSQCTIQSTPLSKTGKFWEIYTGGEKKGFIPHYFPCIENWKDIDLSVPLIGQNPIIPYPWIDINELERERLDDVEYFKQERLGIPSDILHRYITPELLEASAKSVMVREPTNNLERFTASIDVASIVDITAVVIGQNIKGVIHERNLFSTSGDYPQQEEDVSKFLSSYGKQLYKVRIDNTGIGKSLADYLKKRGFRIERVNFATTLTTQTQGVIKDENKTKTRIGVFMAEEFKRALETGSYYTLDTDEPCQFIRQANNHTLNVEQLETPTREKRYSGKRNGRDDFFWARAMLCADFNTSTGVGFKSMMGSVSNLGTTNRNRTVKQFKIVGLSTRRKYAGW